MKHKPRTKNQEPRTNNPTQQPNNLTTHAPDTVVPLHANNDIIISFNNVSKKFCRHLRRGMVYGIKDLTKNLIGMKPDSTRLRKDEFWALKDISFEIRKGEILGIIGPNGSGKSTLLRLLTGIFPPDKGEIMIKGRVGALIAIGAGFHPHMTGRENIYLNGTILGMSRKEIDSKFQDIVDFSEIGEFLEAPVSTYSSGMRVRLGFAISIHCEPDILLVDEVMSVGDIRFQKKCVDKMYSVQKKMAIVFVSHSIRHIYRICERCVLLYNGIVKQIGSASEVVNTYLNMSIPQVQNLEGFLILESIDSVSLEKTGLYDKDNQQTRTFEFGKPFAIRICFESKEVFHEVICGIHITTVEGSIVTVLNTETLQLSLEIGKNQLECYIEKLRLIPGVYFLKVRLIFKKGGVLVEADLGNFRVCDPPGALRPMIGFYRENAVWSFLH